MAVVKKCSGCQEVKPAAAFHKNAGKPLNLAAYCKQCRKSQRYYSNAVANRKWRQRNPVKSLLICARQSARRKGYEFTLSEEHVVIPENCPVFGFPLIATVGTGARSDHTPTIDRIDNSRGYVPGNIVVVSWRANRLKNDAPATDLRLLADFYEGLQCSMM